MSLSTRRTFLQSATAFASSTLVGCQSVAQTKAGLIDAHVHVWTPDTDKYPLAEGFKRSDMKPASFTPEQLFAHTQPAGVSRVVLIQMSYYKTDNHYMLDMMAAHPGVFSGVAIVDENASGVAAKMRELAKQGVRGFRIHPSGTQNIEKWLGSSGMQEMWTTAADEGLNMCLLINPSALGAVSDMCEKFPKTPVVIDHFARIGIDGTVSRADLDRLLHLSAHPKVTLKTSAFYALGKKAAPYIDLGRMIQECRDTFGAKRLMWASDCPFQVEGGHTYANSIALIRDRLDFLTEDDKEWMLRKTAERVFFS
jgi:predicted TIM-barrel fold metal-dependent hydrolase